jgi:alpha-tubulin suppressor-like RCC1 family protein
MMCWGNNNAGQLGAPGPNQLVPGPVSIDSVKNVATGTAHSCARKEDGSVWCWGDHVWGQLAGAPATGAPVQIPGLPSATAITAGGDQTCVIASDGAVWCWGIVHDSLTPTVPIEVVEASFGAIGIAGGVGHACAANAAHTVRCWGSDGGAAIGDGEIQL